MIKNRAFRKIIIKSLFPLLSFVNHIIPKDKKRIFIYSGNGVLLGNNSAIAEFLVKNGFNKRYRIIIGNAKRIEDFSDCYYQKVEFVNRNRCIQNYLRSGFVFYDTGKIPIIPSKKQVVVCMWHGTPIKRIGLLKDNSERQFYFSHTIAISEFYRPIIARCFGCPEKNVYICGEPKTDRMFKPKVYGSQKMIVWTPTFRQSNKWGTDSDETELLPLFSKSEWGSLNSELTHNNIKMIVKLHPAQLLGDFKKVVLSNLAIYSHASFVEDVGNLYDLLSQADALIADYSSVYLQFLMLDRPICFALSDYESYKDTRGFVMDSPIDYMAGQLAFSKYDVFTFIDKIANGIDEYKVKRKQINDLLNTYSDGHNTKRLLEIVGIKN